MCKLTMIALGVLALSLHAWGADVAMVSEPARPADEFADSIGVNTHFGYADTMYGKKWEEVRKLLTDCGIRYVRDILHPRMDELYKQFGIRAIVLSDPGQGSLDRMIQQWAAHRDLIAALEGPNEADIFWSRARQTYRGQGWPRGVKLFQDDLYTAVKANAALNDVPVIAPTTARRGDNLLLAPLSSFDCLVMHSYPGGKMPSSNLDDPDFSSLRDALQILGLHGRIRPVVATETGYHTCLPPAGVHLKAQPGVSTLAQAKYIPRLVAEYFNDGVQRTVLYEFGSGVTSDPAKDPEACFGLLNQDASPKPAYFALQQLIRLTGQAVWNQDQQKWIRPSVKPATLTYALQDAPPTVHHTLLRRSDGTFQLLVWNEIPSFDLATGQDIANTDVAATLLLADPATVTVTTLDPSSEPFKMAGATAVPVAIRDEVSVVTIRPSGQTTSEQAAPTSAPAGVQVRTTNTSADISWPAASDVAAYWVRCDGRDMGQAPPPGPDGQIHFQQKRLLPAMTYPYQIVAVSRDGGISPPADVAVTTNDALPDLTVVSIAILPPHPRVGQTVSFAATIANRGNAPTEDGVTIAVTFSVDDNVICWCDTDHKSLPPAQQVTLTPDNGPKGSATWTATPGPHRITALVDDLNRIAVSDKSNDSLTVDLPAPAP